MALSLRLSTGSIGCLIRPAAASSSLSIPRSTQCRPFSQAPQRWGYKTQNFGPPSIAQPSMKVRQKEALKDMSQLPNDIGLLPGTFVRPLWRDMPSIFQNPKERWVMERASVVTWFLGLASVLLYGKASGLPKWKLMERRNIARNLYVDMYRHYASGDLRSLRKICCDSIYKTFADKIKDRPANEKTVWTLVKWLRRPSTFGTGMRILSDRAIPMSEISPNSSIRQIVVRVNSRQSTHKETWPLRAQPGQGNVKVSPTKTQDTEEYLVMNRINWGDQDTGWRIWGYTKPTDFEAVKGDSQLAPGLRTWERVEAMKDRLSGPKA